MKALLNEIEFIFLTVNNKFMNIILLVFKL